MLCISVHCVFYLVGLCFIFVCLRVSFIYMSCCVVGIINDDDNNTLPHQSLQDVFRATVEAKLLYAAPAWSGFCTAADLVRLNSFLRRCVKLGYRDPDSPDLDSLFSDSDELLFDRINHTSQHILQQYLPDRPDLNYSLRSRHHNKTLFSKTSELNDRDFTIRNLYTYCY